MLPCSARRQHLAERCQCFQARPARAHFLRTPSSLWRADAAYDRRAQCSASSVCAHCCTLARCAMTDVERSSAPLHPGPTGSLRATRWEGASPIQTIPTRLPPPPKANASAPAHMPTLTHVARCEVELPADERREGPWARLWAGTPGRLPRRRYGPLLPPLACRPLASAVAALRPAASSLALVPCPRPAHPSVLQVATATATATSAMAQRRWQWRVVVVAASAAGGRAVRRRRRRERRAVWRRPAPRALWLVRGLGGSKWLRFFVSRSSVGYRPTQS